MLTVSTPDELSDSDHEEIQRLCRDGDSLAEAGRYAEAIVEYARALEIVPEPKSEWNATTWILAAIGDAYFLAGDGVAALRAFEDAMSCSGAVGNPFLHLRLGELLYDAGEEDAAADELMRAYMGAGEDVFAREHPRYRAFLATRAII